MSMYAIFTSTFLGTISCKPEMVHRFAAVQISANLSPLFAALSLATSSAAVAAHAKVLGQALVALPLELAAGGGGAVGSEDKSTWHNPVVAPTRLLTGR